MKIHYNLINESLLHVVGMGDAGAGIDGFLGVGKK